MVYIVDLSGHGLDSASALTTALDSIAAPKDANIDLRFNRLPLTSISCLVDFVRAHPSSSACVGNNAFSFEAFYSELKTLQAVHLFDTDRLTFGWTEQDKAVGRLAAKALNGGGILQLTGLLAKNDTSIDQLQACSGYTRQADVNVVTERHVNDAVKLYFSSEGYEVFPLTCRSIKRPDGTDNYSFDGVFCASRGGEKLLLLVDAEVYSTKTQVMDAKKKVMSFVELLSKVADKSAFAVEGAKRPYTALCNYLVPLADFKVVGVMGGQEVDGAAGERAYKFDMHVITSDGDSMFKDGIVVPVTSIDDDE